MDQEGSKQVKCCPHADQESSIVAALKEAALSRPLSRMWGWKTWDQGGLCMSTDPHIPPAHFAS
jgi:hypothetical protein